MSSSTSQSISSACVTDPGTFNDNEICKKYKNYRQRNNHHVRKSRERKVEREKDMVAKYAENEKRIEYLESLANDLTAELLSNKKPKKLQKKQNKAPSKETRPEWFGAPF